MRDLILIENLRTNKSTNFSYQFAAAAKLGANSKPKKPINKCQTFHHAWWQWWKCRSHIFPMPSTIFHNIEFRIKTPNHTYTRNGNSRNRLTPPFTLIHVKHSHPKRWAWGLAKVWLPSEWQTLNVENHKCGYFDCAIINSRAVHQWQLEKLCHDEKWKSHLPNAAFAEWILFAHPHTQSNA